MLLDNKSINSFSIILSSTKFNSLALTNLEGSTSPFVIFSLLLGKYPNQ